MHNDDMQMLSTIAASFPRRVSTYDHRRQRAAYWLLAMASAVGVAAAATHFGLHPYFVPVFGFLVVLYLRMDRARARDEMIDAANRFVRRNKPLHRMIADLQRKGVIDSADRWIEAMNMDLGGRFSAPQARAYLNAVIEVHELGKTAQARGSAQARLDAISEKWA